MTRSTRNKFLLAALVVAVLIPQLPTQGQESSQPADVASDYRSPFCVVTSADGQTVYASDRTKSSLAILDAQGMTKRGEIAVHGNPLGLALSADGSTLYVAEHGAGTEHPCSHTRVLQKSPSASQHWISAIA